MIPKATADWTLSEFKRLLFAHEAAVEEVNECLYLLLEIPANVESCSCFLEFLAELQICRTELLHAVRTRRVSVPPLAVLVKKIRQAFISFLDNAGASELPALPLIRPQLRFLFATSPDLQRMQEDILMSLVDALAGAETTPFDTFVPKLPRFIKAFWALSSSPLLDVDWESLSITLAFKACEGCNLVQTWLRALPAEDLSDFTHFVPEEILASLPPIDGFQRIFGTSFSMIDAHIDMFRRSSELRAHCKSETAESVRLQGTVALARRLFLDDSTSAIRASLSTRVLRTIHKRKLVSAGSTELSRPPPPSIFSPESWSTVVQPLQTSLETLLGIATDFLMEAMPMFNAVPPAVPLIKRCVGILDRWMQSLNVDQMSLWLDESLWSICRLLRNVLRIVFIDVCRVADPDAGRTFQSLNQWTRVQTAEYVAKFSLPDNDSEEQLFLFVSGCTRFLRNSEFEHGCLRRHVVDAFMESMGLSDDFDPQLMGSVDGRSSVERALTCLSRQPDEFLNLIPQCSYVAVGNAHIGVESRGALEDYERAAASLRLVRAYLREPHMTNVILAAVAPGGKVRTRTRSAPQDARGPPDRIRREGEIEVSAGERVDAIGSSTTEKDGSSIDEPACSCRSYVDFCGGP